MPVEFLGNAPQDAQITFEQPEEATVTETASEQMTAPAEQPTTEPAADEQTHPEQPAKEEEPEPKQETPAEQPKSKFAHLEEDAHAEKLLKAYEAGPEALKEYLSKITANYDNMTAQDILRLDMERSNPHLSKEDVDYKLSLLLEEKFKQGEYDDRAKEIGEKDMKAEADRIRNEWKKADAEYQLPERPPVNPDEVIQKFTAEKEAEYKVQMQEVMKQAEQAYTSDPVTKEFDTNRLVEFGEGEERFRYEVPKTVDVKAQALDPNKLLEKFRTADGKVDTAKLHRFIAIANDEQGVMQQLSKHFTSLGKASVEKDLRNPNTDTPKQTPSAAPKAEVLGSFVAN